MEVIETKIRKSNKEHKCNFCGGIILKGEKYDWQKLKFENILYDWKAHLSCCDIASELSMFDNADEGVTEEYFKESIDEEYLNIIPEDDIRPLPPFSERLITVKQKYGIR